MASPFPRDRLQPSLLDRLEDAAGAEPPVLAELRAGLDRLLDDGQRLALERLLQAELPGPGRRPTAEALAPFAGLDEAGRETLGRVLDLERERRLELRRHVAISPDRLREAVLRDLENLLNTTRGEAGADGAGGPAAASLDGFPLAGRSVVNYGIPPLAGRARTPEGFADLALAIERAIESYEPRVRKVRVGPAPAEEAAAGHAGAVAFLIEGELWGYPFAEHLRVRTVVDLDVGRVEVARAGRPA